MHFPSAAVGAIGQLVLELLRWLHSFTSSWPWALVLLALGVRGVPQVLLFLAPGRAARGAYNRDCLQLRKRYPNTRSDEYISELGRIARQHNLPLWTIWPPMLLGAVEFGARGFVYVGLYWVFTKAPELRGVPLWWLADLTAPPTWQLLCGVGVVLFVLAVLNEFVRRIHGESPTQLMTPKVIFYAWLCSYFPIGLVFYYLASQAMYLLTLLLIVFVFAAMSKLTR